MPRLYRVPRCDSRVDEVQVYEAYPVAPSPRCTAGNRIQWQTVH